MAALQPSSYYIIQSVAYPTQVIELTRSNTGALIILQYEHLPNKSRSIVVGWAQSDPPSAAAKVYPSRPLNASLYQ